MLQCRIEGDQLGPLACRIAGALAGIDAEEARQVDHAMQAAPQIGNARGTRSWHERPG